MGLSSNGYSDFFKLRFSEAQIMNRVVISERYGRETAFDNTLDTTSFIVLLV